MKIYWLKLRDTDQRGVEFGITARDWDDAMSLLMRAGAALTSEKIDASMVEVWREIKSADELDQNHVVPNMGVIVRRGVWFPNMPHIQ